MKFSLSWLKQHLDTTASLTEICDKLTALGVAGPGAKDVLRKAGISFPDLAALEFGSPTCDCDCGCVQCTVVRGDDPAGTSYEIWLTPEQFKPTWDALVAAGAAPIGHDALELRRISFGIPHFGVDIRERDLPQETGQTRALNFTKGCYLGQEIVERIRSRGAVHRRFGAFDVEGGLPEAATKILAEDKEVGEVTSSAVLPFAAGDRPFALGYLRREAAGKELRGGAAILKPSSLPII